MHVCLPSVWTIPTERLGSVNKTKKVWPGVGGGGLPMKDKVTNFRISSTFPYPNPADCRTLGNHSVAVRASGRPMHLLDAINHEYAFPNEKSGEWESNLSSDVVIRTWHTESNEF